MWRILTGISGGFELERVAEFTGICTKLGDIVEQGGDLGR
jgi:hypothetical protein